jgi:succinyl-CoA synthetase beta subunit
MNLHEYQAKQLFTDYGVVIGPGEPASSPDAAVAAAKSLGGTRWVVKAQVHAGGRGKAVGVKLVDSTNEVRTAAASLLGTRLVTKQSAPDGQPINCVLVQSAVDIRAELYLGMLVDRARRRIAIMASRAGGMDIEEVAATEPEKLFTVAVNPITGLQAHHCNKIGFGLDLDKKQRKQLAQLLDRLYRLFLEKDLSLIEINPLIIDGQGDLVALDAKITVDDNALYRQAALAELRDASQEDAKESQAKEHELNYVTLDGDIACMVNGAGLAMATMDIIKLHGGEPANFLDVGGGATSERVTEAFKIITSTDGLKAILVNIFGGIVRCDLIAEGIVQAVKEVGVTVPVVVRLEGTNVEQGKTLLAESGLAIVPADDLADAARKAVAAARGEH